MEVESKDWCAPPGTTGPRSGLRYLEVDAKLQLGDECRVERFFKKPSRNIAIVGGGPSRSQAPFSDVSWEIWMFGRGKLPIPRVDRWFEMHSVQQMKRFRGDRKRKMWYPEYWRFLSRLKCPVYMIRQHADIPRSVAYPLDDAIRRFGRCFTSSVSYAIALAIMEGCDRIGLWGVDLSDKEEYVYQRPAVQYLLGVARKSGISVCLPKDSTLQIPDDPKPVYTKVLYGYDWDSPEAWWNQKRARKQRKEKKKAKARKKARPSKARGRASMPKAGASKAKAGALKPKTAASKSKAGSPKQKAQAVNGKSKVVPPKPKPSASEPRASLSKAKAARPSP